MGHPKPIKPCDDSGYHHHPFRTLIQTAQWKAWDLGEAQGERWDGAGETSLSPLGRFHPVLSMMVLDCRRRLSENTGSCCFGRVLGQASRTLGIFTQGCQMIELGLLTA